MKNEAINNLNAEINRVYLIKDPDIIRFLLATTTSQFLPADPVWPIIVAPSGGCKSEFINMLSLVAWIPPGENQKEQFVTPISTLTAHTFISGFKATKQASLLNKIINGIITIKDFTSLLSEHPDVRSAIMSQLREIYDGAYSKPFGNGEDVIWKGKITVIAASTFKIHSMKQQYSSMGERFIFYNLLQPDREAAAEKTMDNQEQGIMKKNRQHLSEMYRDVQTDILNTMPKEIPNVDKNMQRDVIALAELATRARSDVQRDFKTQEITEVLPPEMPTRFAGQLQTILQSFQIVHNYETGEFTTTESHIKVVNKIALDSIPTMRRITLQQLAQYESIETAGLATKISLPTNSVRRYLQDLTALEIVDRTSGRGSQGDKWTIKDKYRALITRFEGITFQGGELIGNEPEDDSDDPELTNEQIADQVQQERMEQEYAEQQQLLEKEKDI